MAEILCFIQGGGKSGNTTACFNIGIAFARLGKKVLFVDLDYSGFQHSYDGMIPYKLGLVDYINGLLTSRGLSEDYADSDAISGIYEALCDSSKDIHIVHHDGEPSYDMILSDIRLEEIQWKEKCLEDGILKKVLQPLTQNYDYLLIDCGNIHRDLLFKEALGACTGVIMCVPAYPPAHLTAISNEIYLEQQRRKDFEILAIIMSFYDEHNTYFDQDKYFAPLMDELEYDLDGKRHRIFVVDYDMDVEKSFTFSGADIFSYAPFSRGAMQYAAAAARLLTEIAGEPERKHYAKFPAMRPKVMDKLSRKALAAVDTIYRAWHKLLRTEIDVDTSEYMKFRKISESVKKFFYRSHRKLSSPAREFLANFPDFVDTMNRYYGGKKCDAFYRSVDMGLRILCGLDYEEKLKRLGIEQELHQIVYGKSGNP